MKFVFIFLILFRIIASAEVESKLQSLFWIYDKTHDIDLSTSGVSGGDVFQQRITSESTSRTVELIPQKEGRDKIVMDYDLKGSLKTVFKRDASSGITFFTSFTHQKFPELRDTQNNVLASEIDFEEHTLICKDHNSSGMDPKNNRICIMANRANCNDFYSGMESVDRSTIRTCNQIFNRMFKNNQIPQSSNLRSKKDRTEIPTSAFYSFASDAVQKQTGERLFFHFFRDKDIDETGMGSVLEFLNHFHTACEYYRTPNSIQSNTPFLGPSRGRR